MRYLTFIPILFALFSIAPLAAQDTPSQTGWPIEQHCVGDPTSPPADWTYDGTIFVQGQQGIRALDDYYKTPYFTLFESPFIYAAALSPDGKWYAVPAGYRGYATMSTSSYEIKGIMVVGTDTSRKSYFVPLRVSYEGMFDAYSIPSVRWLDNTHLMYEGIYADDFGTYIIEPFAGEYTRWEGKSSPLYGFVAPDGKLGIVRTSLSDELAWSLLNYPEGEILTTLTAPIGSLVWSPDSTIFVASIDQPDALLDDATHQLALFDRMGERISVIFSAGTQQSPEVLAFSNDGRFLTFLFDDNHLYIVDMQNQAVIETCLSLIGHQYLINGLTWSPHAHQLAFRYADAVDVLDFEASTFYKVSDVPGEVVAWGAAG